MRFRADNLDRSGWADAKAAEQLYEALRESGMQEHYAELAVERGPRAVQSLIDRRGGADAEWAAKARKLIQTGAKPEALAAEPVASGADKSGRTFQLGVMTGRVRAPNDPAPVEPILFYETKESHGAFANFSAHAFVVRDPSSGEEIHAKTSEHFFQAMKFWGTAPAHARAILEAEKPSDAAKMGRDRKQPLRADWESIKDDVMRVAVAHKVAQNEDVKALLLATGSAPLVENAPHDAYWGNGYELGGGGKNMLGVILEEVRDSLRAEPGAGPGLSEYIKAAMAGMKLG